MFPLFNLYPLDKFIKKISSISEERFKEADLNDCFLVDIILKGSKLEVFIDSDDGVKFWQCQKLSRTIEAYLDESKIIGDKYILEVSSPGIERPLKFIRQYNRNIGRNIETKLADGNIISGKLIEINDEGLIIESTGSNKKELVRNNINFDDVVQSKILITFSK